MIRYPDPSGYFSVGEEITLTEAGERVIYVIVGFDDEGYALLEKK